MFFLKYIYKMMHESQTQAHHHYVALSPSVILPFFGVVVYAFAASATTKTLSGVTVWQKTEHDTN